MKITRITSAAIAFSIIIVLSNPISAPGQTADRDALRDRIEALSSTRGPTVAGAPIAAMPLISAIYELRAYEPAWKDPKMVEELLDQVEGSAYHGLNPSDFHVRQIRESLEAGARNRDANSRADTEILCTDALARLGVTLKFGKLDAKRLDPAWNFDREIEFEDPVKVFNDALNSKRISAALENVDPDTEFYDRLRRALVRYRDIEQKGGWPTVSEGPGLKLGAKDERVISLRKRLRMTADLKGAEPADPNVFDDHLEAAVKHFQTRHGIDADGKVGPRTLEELNTTVDARIDQIRATLERFRWVFRELPEDYVIVDIAGYNAHLVRHERTIWSTRVQVGKPYHMTPVFRDTMQYIDFNPTWTIPPGILRNETLPRVRKDPEYLSRNNMSVVTHSGEIIDPSTVDWAATASGKFPYMIRQEPGPDNALGRVKFMFPNQYMVYLHDTPSKGLFARAERAFSHGCIRTQNPFELATLLLEDQGWDRARVDEVVDSLENTRVDLEKPIAVLLLYWTAEADADGTVQFRRDVYNRDAPIIEGLDQPFRVDPPEGLREAIEKS